MLQNENVTRLKNNILKVPDFYGSIKIPKTHIFSKSSDFFGKVNWGLESTSDIMKTPKRGTHFMVEILFNKNASTQSGSNAIKDCFRPAPSK